MAPRRYIWAMVSLAASLLLVIVPFWLSLLEVEYGLMLPKVNPPRIQRLESAGKVVASDAEGNELWEMTAERVAARLDISDEEKGNLRLEHAAFYDVECRLVAPSLMGPAVVEAAKMWGEESTRRVQFSEVRCELLKGWRGGSVVVEAPQMVADLKRAVLEFTEGARAYSRASDSEMAAGRITWFGHKSQPNQGCLVGEGGVSFRRGDIRLTGERLEADSFLKEAKITGGAKLERR